MIISHQFLSITFSPGRSDRNSGCVHPMSAQIGRPGEGKDCLMEAQGETNIPLTVPLPND